MIAVSDNPRGSTVTSLKTLALAIIACGGGIAAGSAVHSEQWLFGPLGLLSIALAFTQAKSAWAAALIGWTGGAFFFAAALPFLLAGYASIGLTGLQPTIGVIALYLLLSIWWPVAFALAYLIGKSPLALSILWPIAELLRSQVFPSIPVAQIASIWSQMPIVQLTHTLSVELVGGLTLAICVVAAFDLAQRQAPYGSAVLVLIATGTGASMITTPSTMPEMPRIATIDTGIPQRLRWDYDALPGYMADLTSRSRAAFDAGTDLVIWPEAAVPYFPDELKEALADARPPAGAYLALGMMVPIESDPGRFWNSFVVLDSELNEVARYDKRHLFPFGEYVPFAELLERWFGLTTIAASTNAIAHGDSVPQIRLLGLPGVVVPAICYEGSFALPRALREVPGAYIVNISNDAWWAGSNGSRFVEQEARLRAIEAGLPLIRVPNMRETKVFDAHGAQTQLP